MLRRIPSRLERGLGCRGSIPCSARMRFERSMPSSTILLISFQSVWSSDPVSGYGVTLL